MLNEDKLRFSLEERFWRAMLFSFFSPAGEMGDLFCWRMEWRKENLCFLHGIGSACASKSWKSLHSSKLYLKTASNFFPALRRCRGRRGARHHAANNMTCSYSNQPTKNAQVLDWVVSSPVFQAAGLEWNDIAQEEWCRLANLLIDRWNLDPNLPETNIRVHQLYMPIFFWLRKICERSSPPIVGISCPQGGGKTTLTFAMQFLFEQLHRKCAVASIDDFYLTRKEQQALFERERNPLLEFRGNPGTHDVELGVKVLSQLKYGKANERVAIPRYNKAAWNGLGDRFPVEEWQQVECPVDVVLLEGWCLGFQPIEDEEHQLIDRRLVAINRHLKAYQKWYDMLDGWLVIEIEDLDWIYEWRAQAEDMLRMQNKGAMTAEQVRDFVSRFMPTYQQYLFPFYRSSFLSRQPNRLQFRIDKQRRPMSLSKY